MLGTMGFCCRQQPMTIAMLGLGSLVTLLFVREIWRDSRRVRSEVRLAAAESPQHHDGEQPPPFVSLIIPVRNEERIIAQCLASVQCQTYPTYECIVVDDGSTDATPSLLAQAAAHDERLRVVRVDTLPPGWTGKSHACWRGAAVARGTWLLFLDADTIIHPELISAVLAYAQHECADVVTLFPFLELVSFWERVILPAFRTIIFASFPLERMHAADARPDEVVANGQCLLVRRDVYDAIGGHAAVRGDVLEDVRLAQAIRATGGTIRAAHGRDMMRVRMYTSLAEIIEGLGKNAVAGFRHSGGRAMWAGTREYLLGLIPIWFLAAGAMLMRRRRDVMAWGIGFQAMLVNGVAIGFWGWHIRRRYALPVWYGILWPFGLVCYGAIAARSLWHVWSGRGVLWKGRTYAGVF